jgi:endonuclease YncB( thermonuclease family)
MRTRAQSEAFAAMRPRARGGRLAVLNRSPRSDAERKAMFARMRRRSGATRSWEPGGPGTKPALPGELYPPTDDAWTDRYEPEFLRRQSAKAPASIQRLMRQVNDSHRANFPDGMPIAIGGAGPAAVRGLGALSRAVKAVAVPLVSGASAAAIGDYRGKHPTMDPRTEKRLAQAQQGLEIVATLSALKAVKTGARKAMPGSFTKADAWLAKAGAAMSAAGNRAAGRAPAWLRALGRAVATVHGKVSELTGNEIPALRQIPEAAKLAVARARGVLEINGESTLALAAKQLLGPAIVAGTVAGVDAYEEHRIGEYQDALREAWRKGDAYELAPDSMLSPVLQFALGTAGNPLEKLTGRLPVGGRFSKDLAETAAYREQYDEIGRRESAGAITAGQAETERTRLAERKPWNITGSALYVVQPAAAGALRYQAAKVREFLGTGRLYDIVADTAERDADTFRTAGGRTVRYLGGDATEIAHAAKPGSRDEPYSREATARAIEINPPGSAVRLVAGGPGEFETDKYGRTVAYVEAIPRAVARIPGLRAVWPAGDTMEILLREGLTQPRYDRLAEQHTRLRAHHDAAVEAIDRKRGVASPEGRSALQRAGLYVWEPSERDLAKQSPLDRASTALGLGLLVSGRTGALRSLGPAGNAVAATWNASLAGLGALQAAIKGPRNQGETLKTPKTYETEQERRVRDLFRAADRTP